MKNHAKTKISLVSILVILGVAARMMRVIHMVWDKELGNFISITLKKKKRFS